MKKIIIYIMALMLLTISVMASNTDFSQHYMQSRAEWSYTGNVYTADSYLTRATTYDTGMNYNLGTWGFCDVTLGGSEFGGVPITLQDTDSDYIHRSFIVNYDTEIKQYGSDCSVVDTYSMPANRNIVSKLGVIRQHRDSTDYYAPNFAVVNYDNVTGYTYMTILTLDDENSTLVLENDVKISNTGDYTDTDMIFGVTGGCFDNYAVSCETNERVFGVFNDDDDDISIVNHVSGTWELKAQVNLSETHADGGDNNNMLFFVDWNANGHNEFIVLGVSSSSVYYMTRIAPISSSPYYTQNYAQESVALGNTKITNSSDIQKYTICQLGDLSSTFEVCITDDLETGVEGETVVLDNDFNYDFKYDGTDSNGVSIMPYFTYDVDSTGDLEICMPNENGGLYYIKCYNETGDQIVQTQLPFNPRVLSPKHMEIMVTEIDGNTSAPELLLSSGAVYSLQWGGTSYALNDWESTFDDTYHGEMFIQDISNDEKNELIYIDDTYFRIYSNDNTPATFLNYTEEEIAAGIGVSSTTTTTLYSTQVNTDTAEEFVSSLNNNISFIIGMLLIVGVVVMAAMAGLKSPLILLFIGLVMAIMVSLLGLISSTALILVIMSFVVLILLSFTLFKGGSE